MPYKQIHWIKLEKRLLNDPRFFTMSEQAQLFYIKFILLCAEYKNKVPRSIPILRQILRIDYDDSTIENLINEIKEHYPKVLSHKDYYYIKGFKEMHNWVFPGNSQGTPKELVDKKEVKLRKEKIQNVVDEYIKLKGWDATDKELVSDIYQRWSRAAKRLSSIAKENALECLHWVAELMNTKNLSWTLETVCKWYPEWEKQGKKSKALKEWEEKYGSKSAGSGNAK